MKESCLNGVDGNLCPLGVVFCHEVFAYIVLVPGHKAVVFDLQPDGFPSCPRINTASAVLL